MTKIVVILLALLIDLTLGDPPNRFHPLLLMGRWLSWGRKLAPSRRRFWFGAGWTVAGTILFTWPFILTKKSSLFVRMSFRGAKRREISTEVACRRKSRRFLSPLPSVRNDISQSSADRWESKGRPESLLTIVAHSVALKPVFAYRNLRRAIIEVSRALEANDLPEARRLLSWHLVSRDTGHLTEAEVAGATIESLAENLTDSLTAPLLAYAAGGLPTAWAYRFVNTADAMWGYRNPEFEQLGKFPARLDDLLNWLPARLTGWLLVVAAWLAREDGRNAARTMLAQHGRTASLNAGWTMSAMAGALRVTLTKEGVYALAGGQRTPDGLAIRRALRVADICVALSVALLAAAMLGRGASPRGDLSERSSSRNRRRRRARPGMA